MQLHEKILVVVRSSSSYSSLSEFMRYIERAFEPFSFSFSLFPIVSQREKYDMSGICIALILSPHPNPLMTLLFDCRGLCMLSCADD